MSLYGLFLQQDMNDVVPNRSDRGFIIIKAVQFSRYMKIKRKAYSVSYKI